MSEFATTLADFLTALQRIDPAHGPPPGQQSAFAAGRWKPTTPIPGARSTH
jgi:aminoglycoside phosphotransferase (APT) family kinase protein